MSAEPVSLAELAAVLRQFTPRLTGDGDTRLVSITQDSRLVSPGSLFVARSGERVSGVSFLPQATLRGAAAVLAAEPRPEGSALPWLQVTHLEKALALAAEAVFSYPSRSLSLVGITGTNGKTTTAHLVHACLAALKIPAARLGTLGFAGVKTQAGSSLTTPEADVVSRYLAEARDEGARHFIMEVSSHALAKARVEACFFQVAAFSNLTQDHLDYHGTLEAYAETKAELFAPGRFARAVINVDDPFGAELSRRLAQRGVPAARRIEVSQHRAGAGGVQLLEQQTSAHGTALRVATPHLELSFRTQLVSAHNRDNWLLALGILHALEIDLRALPEVAESISAAPGRLQRCEEASDDISVLVDYAHTPDALSSALSACRDFCTGRLICVFGCGGDRDPHKRAKMGEAAAHQADYSIVTNDNPRSEDPRKIAEAVVSGMQGRSQAYEVCLERASAITRAVTMAEAGDCVLIAGKGHEDYQIIGERRLHFDDREQAQVALAARRAAQLKASAAGRI